MVASRFKPACFSCVFTITQIQLYMILGDRRSYRHGVSSYGWEQGPSYPANLTFDMQEEEPLLSWQGLTLLTDRTQMLGGPVQNPWGRLPCISRPEGVNYGRHPDSLGGTAAVAAHSWPLADHQWGTKRCSNTKDCLPTFNGFLELSSSFSLILGSSKEARVDACKCTGMIWP